MQLTTNGIVKKGKKKMAAKHSEKYKAGREDKGLSRPSIWVPTHRVQELRDIADNMLQTFELARFNNNPFKISDLVITVNGNIGEIVDINKNSKYLYPVLVQFDNDIKNKYTLSGMYCDKFWSPFDIRLLE